MSEKMKGLIEAIESESKLPLPTHGNLARLVAEAFKDLSLESKLKKEVDVEYPSEANTTMVEEI